MTVKNQEVHKGITKTLPYSVGWVDFCTRASAFWQYFSVKMSGFALVFSPCNQSRSELNPSLVVRFFKHLMYKRFHYLSKLNPCVKLQINRMSHMRCYNFSSNVYTTAQHHIFFQKHFEDKRYVQYHIKKYRVMCFKLQRLSWKDTDNMCKSRHLCLPIFSKRSQMDELVAIIKFTWTLPPIEALFIGLTVNNLVSSIFYFAFL